MAFCQLGVVFKLQEGIFSGHFGPLEIFSVGRGKGVDENRCPRAYGHVVYCQVMKVKGSTLDA